MAAANQWGELQTRQKTAGLDTPLWDYSRTTAWRRVVSAMKKAGMTEGPHCVSKGVRHSYAINAMNNGMPMSIISTRRGHAQMETTAISANAVGEAQQAIAIQMWS